VLATTNGELDVLLALALQTNLPELTLNFFHHAAHLRQVASNSLLNGHGLFTQSAKVLISVIYRVQWSSVSI